MMTLVLFWHEFYAVFRFGNAVKSSLNHMATHAV